MTAADQPGGRARRKPVTRLAWGVLSNRQRGIDMDCLDASKRRAIAHRDSWNAEFPDEGPWRIARFRITEIPEHGGSDE